MLTRSPALNPRRLEGFRDGDVTVLWMAGLRSANFEERTTHAHLHRDAGLYRSAAATTLEAGSSGATSSSARAQAISWAES
eukprot:1195013-Prorocentrum_minimum.AAC.8